MSDDGIGSRIRLAVRLEGLGIGEYVAAIVEEKLLGDPALELQLLSSLSDDDVLAMADMQMPPDEDARMSELLDRNGEGQLLPLEREDLDGFLQ